jgi:hypothetical protein
VGLEETLLMASSASGIAPTPLAERGIVTPVSSIAEIAARPELLTNYSLMSK